MKDKEIISVIRKKVENMINGQSSAIVSQDEIIKVVRACIKLSKK